VVVRRIDAASGLLAPTGTAGEAYAGQTLDEYFIAGTEPVEEAIAAALPAKDVVMDLYDDGADKLELQGDGDGAGDTDALPSVLD
jgi:hypothetical protein